MTALLFAVTVGLQFPGALNPDAVDQLNEISAGRLKDWHPPMMAEVWRWLQQLWPGPAPMLLLQVSLHWLGVCLIADALAARGLRRMAWTVLAVVGLMPLTVNLNGGIWSDAQMSSAFLCAFGLVFWQRARGIRPAAPFAVVATVLLLYATLVRSNAVFAFAPLFLYVVWPRVATLHRQIVFSLLLAFAMIPVAMYVNHNVLQAERTGVERSLQIFDIAGVAHYSEDTSQFERIANVSPATFDICFSLYWWDTYSRWGACHIIWDSVTRAEQESRGLVMRAWIGSMLGHPLAYLEHRLKHFNSMMYFLVPADHYRFFGPSIHTRPAISAVSISTSAILADLAKRMFLWPFAWLIIEVGLLTLLMTGRMKSDLNAGLPEGALQALLLSGIAYTVFYLPLSVATAMRYHIWLLATGPAALVMLAPQLAPLLRRGDGQTRLWVLLLTVACVVAALFRILDISSFLQ